MARQEGYAFPEFLADTEWLAEHLDDGNIRIVDTDVAAAYQRGHIPGAVLIPDNYEKDPDTSAVHILPPQKFAEMMESLGIGDDTTVVAYDNSRSLYAGRLWWALSYYGHRNVKVLNGGWRKWVSEGRGIGLDPSRPPTGVRFTPRPDASLIASYGASERAIRQARRGSLGRAHYRRVHRGKCAPQPSSGTHSGRRTPGMAGDDG